MYIYIHFVTQILHYSKWPKIKKKTFKSQSNSLYTKVRNTCEKAERILRNTAINDAYRKQRLLEKEIDLPQLRQHSV